jgi:hypothetical protein
MNCFALDCYDTYLYLATSHTAIPAQFRQNFSSCLKQVLHSSYSMSLVPARDAVLKDAEVFRLCLICLPLAYPGKFINFSLTSLISS